MVQKNEGRGSVRQKLAKRTARKNRLRIRNSGNTVRMTNKIAFAKELDWVLGEQDIFADVKLHGNTTWDPLEMVSQALIWSLQDSRHVTDAFDCSLKACEELGMKQTAKSYPRFMDVLSRHNFLSSRVRSRVQRCAEEIGGSYWRDSEWALFAFDGSRVSVPRTVSNEEAFCAANYGQGKTAKYRKKKTKGMRCTKNEKAKGQPQGPQIWLTMVWHMGLRLPWMWRLGPSNSSERQHIEEILNTHKFPKKTLFCGDPGFVGFPLWSRLILAKAHFLVRVGGNVSLLSNYADVKQVKDNVVLCWPKDKMHSGVPPLRLRLVKIKIGKTTMFMLTSVLDKKRLTIKQIVRYYKMRWGIEIEFRGLKQTMDNGELCCRKSDNAIVELEWSILGMAIVELLALRRQIPQKPKKKNGKEYQVTERSLARAVRSVRTALRFPNEIPAIGKRLIDQLMDAKVQKYNNKTDKKARYRPPNPDKKPLKDPSIRKPDHKERKKLRELGLRIAA